MVVAFGVMCALTALAVIGVIYVVIHDAPPRQTKDGDGLAIAGIVMMFAFPLGGFVAGCILLAKQPLSGSIIMVTSVAMGLIYAFVGLHWLATA